MLLRFGAANHLSLKDYQELLLTVSANSSCAGAIPIPGTDRKAVPVVAIYGANASGKSNVLAALGIFRAHIRHSHKRGTAESKVPHSPFQLSTETKEGPTRLDCDVVIDGIRYHYGFALNDERFLEEWLYAYPSGKRQIWFHRDHAKSPEYYFGKFLTGRNRVIQDLTRKNSLFLSAAAQNNHDQLTKIYSYFADKWTMFDDDSDSPIAAAKFLDQTSDKERIVQFLKFADVGIVNADLEEKKMPDEWKVVSTAVRDALRKVLKDEEFKISPEAETAKILKLGHSGSGDECIYLSLDAESRGTRRLISLSPPVFRALEAAQMLVVDELDNSLHTLLARKIVELFSSPSTNPKGGQLIFSTHDTNLLSMKILGREGIWFTEKDRTGATHLYPLSDIRVRQTDNIEKGYLRGRFGAIPFMGAIDELAIGDSE